MRRQVEAEAARTAAHAEAQLKRESSHKIGTLEEEFQLQVKAAAASIEDLEQVSSGEQSDGQLAPYFAAMYPMGHKPVSPARDTLAATASPDI